VAYIALVRTSTDSDNGKKEEKQDINSGQQII
jgi:hypothetical protein